MKGRKKYVIFFLLMIVTLASIYAYLEYNRRPADLLSQSSRTGVTDSALVSLYITDELKANELYLGKPVDVTGTISEINRQGDTLVNVMLGKIGDMHKVSCLLNDEHADDIKKYRQGDHVTIRGICTGYLIDVELNRCVIVQ